MEPMQRECKSFHKSCTSPPLQPSQGDVPRDRASQTTSLVQIGPSDTSQDDPCQDYLYLKLTFQNAAP